MPWVWAAKGTFSKPKMSGSPSKYSALTYAAQESWHKGKLGEESVFLLD